MGNKVAEESEKQEQNKGVEHVKHAKHGLWFGIFTLIVVILVAGAGFYLLSQLRSQQESLGGELNKEDMQLLEISKQMSSYQEQFAAIQNNLATVEANLAGKEVTFNKALSNHSQLQTERLTATRKELTTSIKQLQRQLGKTRSDWLLADADYLLNVASQRLHLVGDVNTAREALEAADERLRESGDAAAFKVRAQIAKELSALRSIQVADVVGIYATIQTLQDRVQELALNLPCAGKPLTPSTEVHDHTDNEDTATHSLLDAALKQLEGLVTIRHSDQAVAAILTPQQAEFMRQQLNVRLEMIKIALVQSNDALYKINIKDAD